MTGRGKGNWLPSSPNYCFACFGETKLAENCLRINKKHEKAQGEETWQAGEKETAFQALQTIVLPVLVKPNYLKIV